MSELIVILLKNLKFRIALEKASWILNAAGMRLFHEAITMSDNKRDDMKIEDCEDGGEIVVEEEEIVQDMSEGRCVGT